MKKIISLILASVLLLICLVSCSGDENTGAETTSGNAPEGNETSTAQAIEDRDFDGYVFRVLSAKNHENITYDEDELDMDSTYDKAVVERDSEAKDRFNISFADVKSNQDVNIVDYVLVDIINPIASYDVGRLQGDCSAIISNNASYNANDIPHMNLEKEYYSQQSNTEFNIMGKQYFFVAAYTGFPGATPLIFNKKIINELKLEMPYETVLAGDWTIEKLLEYTSAGYKDMTGNGKTDDDIYGYCGHERSIPYFYQGMGGKTTERDENGAVVPVISNEEVDAIYSKVQEFYNSPNNWINSSLDAGVHSSSHRMFYDGNAMFCYWTTATLRYTEIDEFEYGLAIIPKYDVDQKNYHCPTAGGAVFCPANMESTDTTGYLIEALSEMSWRIVYPATIQEAVEFEELTDEESIEVKKLVDQSLHYDILKFCDPSGGNLGSCAFIYYCLKNKTTPSAEASSVKPVYERIFHEFFYGKAQ